MSNIDFFNQPLHLKDEVIYSYINKRLQIGLLGTGIIIKLLEDNQVKIWDKYRVENCIIDGACVVKR